MSRSIDWQFRFWMMLVFMFIMIEGLSVEIGKRNFGWSIFDIVFIVLDAIFAKISYDNWKCLN